MSISGVERDINKLLKKIKTTAPKERVELHNVVGGLYTEIGLYDEAKSHHEDALELCKSLGDVEGAAIAYRYIGEAKASCGLFDEAYEDVDKYLELSKKCNNRIEIQRALTTLGRIQLMQAQQMKDESYYHSEIKHVALKAERTFQKALNLTRSIRQKVETKEFDQMYAGLLVNMGLVKELCGKRKASIEHLCEARELYKSSKSKEELFRCLIFLCSMNRQAKDMTKASQFSKEALDVAKGIGKKLMLCEAYIEMGLVHITLRQFKEAKRAFKMAHREDSPNEDDNEKAIRCRKISHLIFDTFNKLEQDDLTRTNRSKYCERIADLLCKLTAYSQAIIYYKSAWQHAKADQKPKKEIAKIVYSLAETFYDNGQLQEALKCFEQELAWSQGDKARCQTMFRIAQIRDQLDHHHSEVCETYERALEKSDMFIDLKHTILENYIAYMKEKECNLIRCQELKKIKANLPEVCDENDQDEEDEDLLEDEITHLNVDDFVSDDDEDDEVLMLNRRRASKKFKTNELGETPLHQAVIKGEVKRVKLLLEQGHEVNLRDHCGWTPLHEACNHGYYEIANMLIDKGAEVSNHGPGGMTPLHDAASNGHFDVMQLLMKNRANVVALTSKGESVLQCLRDYKKRQASEMSDRQLSDYREVETDLIDKMDKCGFDLMANKSTTDTIESQRRPKSPPRSISSRVSSSFNPGNNQSIPIAKPKSTLSSLDTDTEIVKDYRATLGHLKRKHRTPSPQDVTKRPNPAVIYEPEFDPSAPTKHWLIDDVTKAPKRQQTHMRNIHVLESSDDEYDDDDFGLLNRPSTKSRPIPRDQEAHVSKDSYESPIRSSSRIDSSPSGEVITLDDDSQDIAILSSPRLPQNITTPRDVSHLLRNSESRSSIWSSNYQCDANSIDRSSSRQKSTERDRSPIIYAQIENFKLLIQIPDIKASLKWLKDSIVDRYEAIAGARPKITIVPANEPDCIVSDHDTCEIFLNDKIIAKIVSWNLEPISESYKSNCTKSEPRIEPETFVADDLANQCKSSIKLDLSYTRFPQLHIKPVIQALARRDYLNAKLTGATCLFRSDYEILINTVCSWSQLANLELRCVGLVRSQFEHLCSKISLKNLKFIDLSYNCITYKTKNDFTNSIQRLTFANPSLRRLDISYNQLKFIGTLRILVDQDGQLNIVKPLGLDSSRFNDFELIATGQNDRYMVTRVDF